jgi:hypothetical protein
VCVRARVCVCVCVCSGGVVIPSPAASRLPSALSKVVCKGSEENLGLCSLFGIAGSICSHDSAAAVRCGECSSSHQFIVISIKHD